MNNNNENNLTKAQSLGIVVFAIVIVSCVAYFGKVLWSLI